MTGFRIVLLPGFGMGKDFIGARDLLECGRGILPWIPVRMELDSPLAVGPADFLDWRIFLDAKERVEVLPGHSDHDTTTGLLVPAFDLDVPAPSCTILADATSVAALRRLRTPPQVDVLPGLKSGDSRGT